MREKNAKLLSWSRWTAPLGAVLLLAACGDGLFDVRNPGRIEDDDLNSALGVTALVTGMSSDFSSSFDEAAFAGARMSDEMAGSGSYNTTGFLRRGIIFVDSEFDFLWEGMQRARWVAESGLTRMSNIENFEFASSPLTARANLLAGLANRWMGEMFCYTMFDDPTVEGEEPEDVQGKDAAFLRAIPYLQQAISVATAAGEDDMATAAAGALAQVYMGLGDWAMATTFSTQVPDDFQWVAIYDANSGREENVMWNETHGRQEMSAFGTLAASFDPNDPRAPFQDCTVDATGCNNANGADGSTPHLMQLKYPDVGSDIPLVEGTEMRLIEAEAALQGTPDITAFAAAINAARAEWGLPAIAEASVTGATGITGDPASMDAWDILDRERFLETWLEGRRIWDLHRWDHPFLEGGTVVYEPDAGARRASCFPVADSECQTNDKIRGTAVCAT